MKLKSFKIFEAMDDTEKARIIKFQKSSAELYKKSRKARRQGSEVTSMHFGDRASVDAEQARGGLITSLRK
jgi:hypothetical protein